MVRFNAYIFRSWAVRPVSYVVDSENTQLFVQQYVNET